MYPQQSTQNIVSSLLIHSGSSLMQGMIPRQMPTTQQFPVSLEGRTCLYVTRSRKRGPFPQKSVCELDLSADSAKSVVHARGNRLTLARSVPKLQSFEYHTRAYLGFEISAFISVL